MSRRSLSLILCCLAGVGPPGVSGQAVTEVFRGVWDAEVIVQTTQTEYPFLTTKSPVSVPGTGSGVLIAPDEVLTAAHVVQAASGVVLEFPSGEEIAATVVASNTNSDVAALPTGEALTVTVLRGGPAVGIVGSEALIPPASDLRALEQTWHQGGVCLRLRGPFGP